jgi:hypothetical protein
MSKKPGDYTTIAFDQLSKMCLKRTTATTTVLSGTSMAEQDP